MTIWQPSPPVPHRERPQREERVASDTPPDLLRIKSALDAIPNSGDHELDYTRWFRIVCAVHHAGGGSDAGLDLVHEFSARCSRHDGDFLRERVWPYVRSERVGELVTERTLFAIAAEHGWTDPSIADDFVDLTQQEETTSEEPSERSRYEFVSFAEFVNGPEPEYLIDGVVPKAGLVVVYGASTSGKTFMAIDIVAAVARGTTWRDCAVTQGRVGYIVAEGAGGFRNRLKAYARHNEINDFEIALLAGAPNFGEKKDITDLIHAMRKWGRMDLIVVDTFAQVMSGGDENSGEDVGRALGHCRTIHEVTGATVMLIHHSGKDETRGARGWSGLRAAADAELEVARCDNDRVVTVKKMKDGEDGAEFSFKLLTVPVGLNKRGDVVSSCVIEHCATVPREQRKRPLKGEHEKLVMRVVSELQEIGGGRPTAGEVIDMAVSQLEQTGQRDRRGEVVKRALNSLVVSRHLISEAGRIGFATGDET